ncbi:enoyl-CoA delta isomerase 2, peroxisomal [Cajanus cajan]|uniref:Delta(3)-Delta(2)-enoyl-CoA isomerase n=1 Tax=Cajanus cajan TaxID=3821 RepID=A0A151T7F5_CAJCA|nr:enoyl-CoA delta isomerase 2, peroxisomal [Cajanus cajan]KYP62967.1 Carnitinyl-CoA dehydratase [Cajanus cajan]
MCSLEKRGNVWVLSIAGDGQNRLSPTLIDSLLSALTRLTTQATPGSVLLTTAHGKFFSNGFDLAWAQSAASPSAALLRLESMVASLKPVVAALIALPMPTIAAVNGHASAAGLLLALSHDYVLMRSDYGVLYMPEVNIGLPMPDYFAAVMRSKIRSAAALRDLMLGGAKVRAAEAVKMGMVESAHDSAESTVEAAMRLGERLAQRKWLGEVYAEIRKSLYPDACIVLGLTQKPIVSKI